MGMNMRLSAPVQPCGIQLTFHGHVDGAYTYTRLSTCQCLHHVARFQLMSRETVSMAAKTDETERSTEQLVMIQCKRMPYNPITLCGQGSKGKKQRSMHREIEGLPCGRCSIPGLPWGNQV